MPTPSSFPTLRFYAELLPNIRSITISIHLPFPPNASTKLTLSTPHQLQLHHDGEFRLFDLPVSVIASTSRKLLEATPIIAPSETKLSYRLPVAPGPYSQLPTAPENYVPWSAVSLSSSSKDVSLRCKTCSLELVSGDRIKIWKDLPSSNWADMMDFWHCHKPETESDIGDTAVSKYAGLQGGYTTVEGTALVELTYFLVAEGDCGGSVETLEDATGKGRRQLCCSNCRTILGIVDIDGENSVRGWRLNKWNIKLQLAANGIYEEYTYPIGPFLSAQLLAFAEGEGIRRLIVSCDDGSGDSSKETSRLKLWLFNSDIKYTSTETRRPVRAVKVFYQEVEVESGTGTGTGQGTSLGNGGFEEVRLIEEMVRGLRGELNSSTEGLLEELKWFREWKVGTLQRFEPENV